MSVSDDFPVGSWWMCVDDESQWAIVRVIDPKAMALLPLKDESGEWLPVIMEITDDDHSKWSKKAGWVQKAHVRARVPAPNWDKGLIRSF